MGRNLMQDLGGVLRFASFFKDQQNEERKMGVF
jgi:hypothetical protein